MHGRKHSNTALSKMSIALKGRVFSDAHKKKLSHSLTNRKLTESTKQKMREWHVSNPNKTFSNTSIERKIATALDTRHIRYFQNIGLSDIANVDFYLPTENVVIQCDGCFYHNCLEHHPTEFIERRERDDKQNHELKKAGYHVYRFWEHDINESADQCILKVIELS